jgi:hypothetical protein
METPFEPFNAAVGTVHNYFAILIDKVSLNPCPEIKRQIRHFILSLAGIRTTTTSNASIYPDAHSP